MDSYKYIEMSFRLVYNCHRCNKENLHKRSFDLEHKQIEMFVM
jgi:hypothetical protein